MIGEIIYSDDDIKMLEEILLFLDTIDAKRSSELWMKLYEFIKRMKLE